MLSRKVYVSREAFIFFLIAVFIFGIIRMFLYFDRNLRPTILSVASARADIIATEAINSAVSEKVARNILYQDLILLEKDREGRIVMAQTNNMEVNRLMSETTMRVQETLTSLKGEKIYIPLGQALGSYLLANVGPRIPITLIPIGFVNTEIIDEFEEAGINQVRHKIYLDIHAEVEIIIPFVSQVTKVSTTVPIVDANYIGEVPDTVINLQFPSGQTAPLPPSPQLPAEP
ncbi:sporulation protein YunB [Dethiobacter alkaliphilus]|uniref:sporulation protein YunB n=1 Tax=Dethiobacter alkaliphilus TaxID=427926 RepID=UPI00222644BA|nr:sporulation protein YunB [Dethiobacter alkaliphilus]MCW3491165.1 sporulation protein YunB [Dethiobacter alkaliphilus]